MHITCEVLSFCRVANTVCIITVMFRVVMAMMVILLVLMAMMTTVMTASNITMP